MNRATLIEAMARAMAAPLGARKPYDSLPEDASQPKLADGSGLSQEILLEAAAAAISAIAPAIRAEALEEAAVAMDDWPCRAAAIRALMERRPCSC